MTWTTRESPSPACGEIRPHVRHLPTCEPDVGLFVHMWAYRSTCGAHDATCGLMVPHMAHMWNYISTRSPHDATWAMRGSHVASWGRRVSTPVHMWPIFCHMGADGLTCGPHKSSCDTHVATCGRLTAHGGRKFHMWPHVGPHVRDESHMWAKRVKLEQHMYLTCVHMCSHVIHMWTTCDPTCDFSVREWTSYYTHRAVYEQ